MLRFETRKRQEERIAVLTGAEAPSAYTEIPSVHDGCPVRVIASRAFAGRQELKEVSLPETLDTLEGFAFHNCKSLRRISAFDSVTEYHDGVIRATTALRTVEVMVRQDNFLLVSRMLADSDYTLTFDLTLPDGRAELTFPGFSYDFTENTMARVIQFNITGSGMAFRECVSKSGIDYAEYDRMFERALLDGISIISDVAFGRLMYPYRLSERAKASYEAYLRKHGAGILRELIGRGDTEKIRFYAAHDLITKEALSEALAAAVSKKDARITALLMEREAALHVHSVRMTI
ncbi:MAG: leucine-rich repeat protein [Lachnospiraceae bacterium]|nr:leucine-rich repeat protein [Lachnospiraceae bacterium]